MSVERRDRKKGTVWRVVWREGSKKRSKTFDRKKDADAWDAKVTLAKRADALEDLDAGRETLSEFLPVWWERYGSIFLSGHTQKNYRYLIKRFIEPTLGTTPLRRISSAAVGSLVGSVQRESGASTARATAAVLQSILGRAVEWDRIKINPAKGVRKPSANKSTATALAPAGVEAILRKLGSRDRVLAALLAYAGLRPGEALALTWEDVGNKTLRISKAIALGEEKGTKTGVERTVRLLEPLRQDLVGWKLASGRRAGLLFPREDGKPWKDTDYRNWRKRVWKEVADCRPYDLRHSFASLLFQEGVNPAEIAEQMGHSLATLLSTYTHVIEELRGSERQSAEELVRQARALPKGQEEGSMVVGSG